MALGGDPTTGAGSTVSEIGPDTCVFIPGGTYYWFENTSDEELVMTRISCTVPPELRTNETGPLDEYGRTFKTRPQDAK